MSGDTGEGAGQLLDSEGLALLGSDATDVDGAAVLLHLPDEFEVIERLEEVLVVDFELTVLQSLIGDPGVLIIVGDLVGVRIEPAIGGNQSVAVEVMV